MHGDKNLEGVCLNVKHSLRPVELGGGFFHVLISFVLSNIVLIINKMDKMIEVTFEKLNAWKAYED